MTPEQRAQAIERYAGGFEAVKEALEGFPPSHLTTRVFAGKWSAAEIVHHLADSEMTGAVRFRRILVEERPLLQGYDQERFAERLRYTERDIGPALDAFRGARATTSQILKSMTEDDWRREGTHSESGHYTAERWLEIYAAHAHDHADQIRRLKEALASRPAASEPGPWW